MSFKLNYSYHLRISYKEDINPCSKLKSVDDLSTKLRKLMTICRKNLYHTQKLQKQAHDKVVKSKNYTPADKVWLNIEHIMTKQNRKLEAKFFNLFRVLHLVGNKVYKLELPKKKRMHDVLYMSLLEHNTTRKGQVNEITSQLNFETDDKGEKYKVEGIQNNAVYARELGDHLPGLYYLVLQKDYLEEENT